LNRIDFLIRKLSFSLLTLLAVVIFNFFLFRILPGDPVQMIVSPRMRPETRERIRQIFGLDKPIWLNTASARASGEVQAAFDSQLFIYLKNLSHGELGESFNQHKPVVELIRARLIPTVILIVAGQLTGIVFGSLLGLLGAWKRKSAIDTLTLAAGLTAWSLPAFWLGILLLILARGKLPMGGFETSGAIFRSEWERIIDVARHVALPAFTLAVLLFGAYMIIVRNSTMEVLAEDYILTAKAKGLSAFRVLISHALKNAALPLVTIIALDLGYALGGTIQIETIFSYPGVGSLMYEAIGQRDYPVLQGVFMLLAVGVIGANFLADLTYALLDPRVKT